MGLSDGPEAGPKIGGVLFFVGVRETYTDLVKIIDVAGTGIGMQESACSLHADSRQVAGPSCSARS